MGGEGIGGAIVTFVVMMWIISLYYYTYSELSKLRKDSTT